MKIITLGKIYEKFRLSLSNNIDSLLLFMQ